MTMIRRRTYQAPETWDGIARVNNQMRVDMLRACGEHASDAGKAAALAGMSRNSYVSACRRLGVPVEHLLDQTSGHIRLREQS